MGNPKLNRFTAPTRRYGAGKNKHDLSIIILGAMIGYRMKSYGPKSMITLSTGETILENQLSVINKAYAGCDIILTIGFEADKMIKKCPPGIRLVENQLFETTNILEEVRLAINNSVNDNILLIQGDVVFNIETIDKITAEDSSAVIIDETNYIPEEDVGATIINDKVSIFSHGISPKFCNIAYVTGKELKFLKSVANDRDKNKLYLFEALNIVIDKHGSFRAYRPDKMKVATINSARDII